MATTKIKKGSVGHIPIAKYITKAMIQAYKDDIGMLEWLTSLPQECILFLARPREIMPYIPILIEFNDHKYRIAVLSMLLEIDSPEVDVWDNENAELINIFGPETCRDASNIVEILAALEILRREKIIILKKKTKWGLVKERCLRDGIAYQRGEKFDQGEELLQAYPDNIKFEVLTEYNNLKYMFEDPEEALRHSFNSF